MEIGTQLNVEERPMAFDNLISKFKQSTKQAADQMGKATKLARLKMDIMTLTGEKTRYLQMIGERTYELFTESSDLDGSALKEKIRNELNQIERIEGRIRDLENQIADLQAMVQQGEGSDVTDATEVKDVSDAQETPSEPDAAGEEKPK